MYRQGITKVGWGGGGLFKGEGVNVSTSADILWALTFLCITMGAGGGGG